jgi:hypothetical protein
LWSVCLSLITMPLVFLFVAANIHDGSRLVVGRWIELSILWPAFLPRPTDLVGAPAFILLLMFAFVGYFAFYFLLLTLWRWVRVVLAGKVRR